MQVNEAYYSQIILTICTVPSTLLHRSTYSQQSPSEEQYIWLNQINLQYRRHPRQLILQLVIYVILRAHTPYRKLYAQISIISATGKYSTHVRYTYIIFFVYMVKKWMGRAPCPQFRGSCFMVLYNAREGMFVLNISKIS